LPDLRAAADLPEDARLAERALAREEPILECPDSLRDEPVEAADVRDLVD
jgi:hypothetical protein